MRSPTFSYDYIVRIYRFDQKSPRKVVGIVEEVGRKDKKAFTTFDELWEILKSGRRYLDTVGSQKKKKSGKAAS